MRFEQYDHISGKVIGPMTSLDFGDVVQSQHCLRPVVIRAFADPTDLDATNLDIYLTGKGAWAGAAFGYRVSATFDATVESGSDLMANHFQVQADASGGSPNGVPVPLDGTSSAWVWLDVQCPADQAGAGTPSFRAIYETD